MTRDGRFDRFSIPGYENQHPSGQGEGLFYGRPKMEQSLEYPAVSNMPLANCSDSFLFENNPSPVMRNDWDATAAHPFSKRLRVGNHGVDGFVGYSPQDINTDGLITIRHLATARTPNRQGQCDRPTRQVNSQGINEILQRVNTSGHSSLGLKAPGYGLEGAGLLPELPREFSREFPPRCEFPPGRLRDPIELHHGSRVPDFPRAILREPAELRHSSNVPDFPRVTLREPAELHHSSREREESWPLQGISAKGLGSLGGANDANCMEKLLVHCAAALEMNDVTLAQQIMWVLNNFADPDGDTNQRVTSHFLKALVCRANKMGSSLLGRPSAPYVSKFLSPHDLAGQVDVTPWYRFGYCAANGAMVDAFEGKDKVHIIDFSTTHCMQWPTLIEALGDRLEGPPHLRLTVHQSSLQVSPFLDGSYDELGDRLRNFARLKKVPLEFHVIKGQLETLDPSTLGLQDDEVLAVNCMMRVHYIPDESADISCPRDGFLRMIKSLDPAIVILVEEDSNLTLPSLVARLKVAFNYLWIPFDALDTFLPRGSSQRIQYEGDIGCRIDNVIACEGLDRIERLETKEKWAQRMKKAGFQWTPFNADVVSEVKQMLDEHAAGWGLKKEEDSLSLTWKGHNVVFATSWVPA